MNISLKTNCFDFQLSAPDHCLENTADESGPYIAANNDNPYDEAGLIHNEALAYYRANRTKIGKDRTKFLDLYADFIKSRGLKTPALQGLQAADYPKVKETLKRLGIFDGVIPICFPFPDLPGFPGGWPNGWPNNSFNKTGDPLWIIYMVYKMMREGRTPIFLRKQIVNWENEVLNSSVSEAEKAKDLISASVMRHSLGYWYEQSHSTNEAKRGGWLWAFLADAVGSAVGSVATPIAGVAAGAVASGVVEAILDEKKKG